MATLHITRGLPASGKTTHARKWVAEDPTSRARVNRDDIRAMLHDSVWRGQATERQVISLRDSMLRSLLRKGHDVICDDTNLPQDTVKDLAKIAHDCGAAIAVIDLSSVDVEECVRRDAARPKPVGEQTIRDMYKKYLAGGRKLPDVVLPQQTKTPGAVGPAGIYIPQPGAAPAVLVDIDGTLALHNGRDPYDETRVGEDLPNGPVIATVKAMHARGHSIICMSGRTEGCKETTAQWLARHDIPYAALFMRGVGDQRKDSEVKRELFDRHVREQYHIVCVFDDRNQVVEMWRRLGLTCFQVAPGDF